MTFFAKTVRVPQAGISRAEGLFESLQSYSSGFREPPRFWGRAYLDGLPVGGISG
ncbi:MAG: hypothetical protein ACR2OA_04960 [Rubripirellula sp.]